jgi:RNA polymerase sigma-70 factor (ECF subfamily)
LQTEGNPIRTYTIDFFTDERGLDQVYTTHYVPLYHYAYTMLNDAELAEEMVQQVFLKLLEKKAAVTIQVSIKAYLYKAVHNECLNHFKHEKVKLAHVAMASRQLQYHTDTPSGKMQYKELELRLQEAINSLPEQCRTIFQLSRFEELKYADIALQLGLSLKTVENQMGKALKRLRLQLADYLPICWYFILVLLYY